MEQVVHDGDCSAHTFILVAVVVVSGSTAVAGVHGGDMISGIAGLQVDGWAGVDDAKVIAMWYRYILCKLNLSFLQTPHSSCKSGPAKQLPG